MMTRDAETYPQAGLWVTLRKFSGGWGKGGLPFRRRACSRTALPMVLGRACSEAPAPLGVPVRGRPAKQTALR